jgi:hypothetical protein
LFLYLPGFQSWQYIPSFAAGGFNLRANRTGFFGVTGVAQFIRMTGTWSYRGARIAAG